MPSLLLKPHTVTESWTQKAHEAEPRGGGELGPCPGSGVGQGTHILWAQRLLPFPQVGTEGHLLPATALLGCSHLPTWPFAAASQQGEQKGKGTSHRSHQRGHLGLLLTHNLPNSLLLLHSRRLPSQKGHQSHLSPGLSEPFLHLSLQRHIQYMLDSSL